jgi:ribonuclease III
VTPNSPQRDIEPASSLNERLGLSFSSLHLLVRALTHSSYINEHPEATEDNERLEFLGDAVLDFIVGEWVYQRFPEMPEGDLTKLRSFLVRNERLAEFSRQLDLGAALRLGRGENSSGGHRRSSMLGSVFEAVIGAIYLDAGLEKVRAFMKPILDGAVPAVLDELHDPKSALLERAQALRMGMPHYRVVGISGPDHARTYDMEVVIQDVVRGRGTGSNKSAAQSEAARDALNNL